MRKLKPSSPNGETRGKCGMNRLSSLLLSGNCGGATQIGRGRESKRWEGIKGGRGPTSADTLPGMSGGLSLLVFMVVRVASLPTDLLYPRQESLPHTAFSILLPVSLDLVNTNSGALNHCFCIERNGYHIISNPVIFKSIQKQNNCII